MFEKLTSFTLDKDSINVLDNSLMKTASAVVLPTNHEYDPNFLYLKVRAVSAGEYWGCFPEGNMVLMGDGSYKDIRDIKEGDFVYTHNGNVKKVLKKFKRLYDGILFNFTYNNGSKFTCTEEHPISYIKHDNVIFKEAKDIILGESSLAVKSIKNAVVFFSKVELCNKTQMRTIRDVYNFEVEDDNSYIVNGICVHNCNKNADYFPEQELKNYGHTFLSAHTFKNHENKLIEGAIGDVISWEWIDSMKFIELLIRIDNSIAPTIVRGFEKGYMTDVSMGCKIKHSVCSYCHNIAKTRNEFCDHVKFHRKQIMSNGVMVYEINIEPKFHDISAVLNGADSTAKVTGIMIRNNKVAFIGDRSSLEKQSFFYMPGGMDKVASTQQSNFNITLPNGDLVNLVNQADMEAVQKLAAIAYGQKEILPDPFAIASEKQAAFDIKENIEEKVAEIEKRIQGNIISIIKDKQQFEDAKNIQENDNLMNLVKLFTTKFWDKNTCVLVGSRLSEIADESGLPKEQIFHKFIEISNIFGVDFTPYEFNAVLSMCLFGNVDNIDDLGNDTPSLPNIMNIAENMGDIGSMHGTGDIPRLVVLRKGLDFMPKELPMGVNTEESIANILRPFLEGRSFHRQFLMPRMLNFNGESLPNVERHFRILVKPRNNFEKIGYDVYEDYRVKEACNLENGMKKFAHVLNDNGLEKNAGLGSKAKAAFMVGLPAALIYSAMQRSRINNGKDVSDINRWAAENPNQAMAVGMAAAPVLEHAPKKLHNKIFGLPEELRRYADVIDMAMEKKAYTEDLIVDSIFKDGDINSIMYKAYNKDATEQIKMATVVMALGHEDKCNKILEKCACTQDDIGRFLSVVGACLEKKAEQKEQSVAKETGKMVLADTLLNKHGFGPLTLVGNTVDGYVFTKAFRAINKAVAKAEDKAKAQ